MKIIEGQIISLERLQELGWQNTNKFFAGCRIFKKNDQRILYDEKQERVKKTY